MILDFDLVFPNVPEKKLDIEKITKKPISVQNSDYCIDSNKTTMKLQRTSKGISRNPRSIYSRKNEVRLL